MKKYLLALLGFLPAVALAQGGQPPPEVTVTTTNIDNTISALTHTINLIVPLMLAVAVVVFIYGVIRYIIAKGGEDTAKARSLIIWSVVGLAAILAVWGLANLLISFFGLTPTQLNNGLLPSVPTGVPAGGSGY
jgi:hypothetical protein